MASTDRRSARDLTEELVARGQRFEFFQAVRLLALAGRNADIPSAIPRGLRFGTPLSLAFPASEILEIEPLEQDDTEIEDAAAMTPEANEDVEASDMALRMTVGFMGLTGPSGVLPTAYTELLIERRNVYRDTAAHRFLEIFSHRAISLFYEAWRKHRFYLGYESGERDGFTRNVLDLVGVGLGPLQARLQREAGGIPDVFLAHFSGLLAQKPMSARSLAALVSGYFGVEARIEQFVGQWIAIPAHEQSRLGAQSCVLGESAFGGERMWDRQNKICVKLGPLKRDEFEDFLPGRPGAAALTELVQFCVGHALACDLELTLARDEVPSLQLGAHPLRAARLGHTSWLNTRSLPADASDARFSLLA